MVSTNRSIRGKSDRRKLIAARSELTLAGKLAASEGEAGDGIDAIIRNISATGVLLETSALLKVGEQVWIDLGAAGRQLASVRWADADLVGCEFAPALSRPRLSAALLQGEAPTSRDAPSGNGASDPELLSAERKRAGLAIAWARKSRGISQGELALMLGVTTTTVCRWERGHVQPRAKIRALLESQLGELSPASPGALGNLEGEEPLPAEQVSDVLQACKLKIAALTGLAPEAVTVEMSVSLSA
ncbi:MAG: helix-turn-helix domain-containing protein [Pseudomonadota bacterium]